MCNMFITLGRQNERLVNPEGAIERLWLPAYIEKLKANITCEFRSKSPGISYKKFASGVWGVEWFGGNISDNSDLVAIESPYFTADYQRLRNFKENLHTGSSEAAFRS